jgi:methylated-DNA-[protein]-cysteine S-methyltransferase
MPATYFTTHASPLGELTLVASEEGLCGLYFTDHSPAPERKAWKRDNGTRFRFDAARAWLDTWFAGSRPRRLPRLSISKGTPFQRRVWEVLQTIPQGKTTTYGDIARAIGSPRAIRAVGAAVGRNPLSLFIPCHRVIGRDGTLTGYAGGLQRKTWLLEHEGVSLTT